MKTVVTEVHKVMVEKNIKVGEVVTLPNNGGKLTVTEILNIDNSWMHCLVYEVRGIRIK